MKYWITLNHGTYVQRDKKWAWKHRCTVVFDPSAVTCIEDIESYEKDATYGTVIYIIGRKEPVVVQNSRADVMALIQSALSS